MQAILMLAFISNYRYSIIKFWPFFSLSSCESLFLIFASAPLALLLILFRRRWKGVNVGQLARVKRVRTGV